MKSNTLLRTNNLNLVTAKNEKKEFEQNFSCVFPLGKMHCYQIALNTNGKKEKFGVTKKV